MNTSRIYTLRDPNTGELRYVGQTTQRWLSERLHSHCKDAKKASWPVSQWIQELAKTSQKPIIEELMIVPVDRAEEYESAIIRGLLKDGIHLLNVYGIDECGSYNGYYRHLRKGEKACADCNFAHNKAAKSKRQKLRAGIPDKRRKLSDKDIQAIRDSTEKQSEIAAIFGINQSAVSRIKKGERNAGR